MGRYIGPVCRLCRREGVKLFLKGNRCGTKKCTLEKRGEHPPGVHTRFSGKQSEYGVRLREKQKAKRLYGLRERQFKKFFYTVERRKGNTGENLLIMLEGRLDNVLYRAGMALSRMHARQIIRHGHITVNQHRVNIPSYLVSEKDIIRPKDKEKSKNLLKEAIEIRRSVELPSWLEVTQEPPEIRVIHIPTRDEVPLEIRDRLIVEICAR